MNCEIFKDCYYVNGVDDVIKILSYSDGTPEEPIVGVNCNSKTPEFYCYTIKGQYFITNKSECDLVKPLFEVGQRWVFDGTEYIITLHHRGDNKDAWYCVDKNYNEVVLFEDGIYKNCKLVNDNIVCHCCGKVVNINESFYQKMDYNNNMRYYCSKECFDHFVPKLDTYCVKIGKTYYDKENKGCVVMVTGIVEGTVHLGDGSFIDICDFYDKFESIKCERN